MADTSFKNNYFEELLRTTYSVIRVFFTIFEQVLVRILGWLTH